MGRGHQCSYDILVSSVFYCISAQMKGNMEFICYTSERNKQKMFMTSSMCLSTNKSWVRTNQRERISLVFIVKGSSYSGVWQKNPSISFSLFFVTRCHLRPQTKSVVKKMRPSVKQRKKIIWIPNMVQTHDCMTSQIPVGCLTNCDWSKLFLTTMDVCFTFRILEIKRRKQCWFL